MENGNREEKGQSGHKKPYRGRERMTERKGKYNRNDEKFTTKTKRVE